ncbi:MAG: MFS transporter [Propionibacteriaceae bacterium]|jgi:MFS family permease|nr:MFS transporter [Propionibacteriaceae bacterium]
MLAFIGIVLTMFSIASMQLILISVMPVISIELGGADLYSWVFSGYMIASLVTIPLFSKLADVYGRRRFYIGAIVVFIGGCVMGAFAGSIEQLIGARLIQGAAAGVLTPVTLAMVSAAFGAEKRGRMIGYFSLVQLVANILSPILGELITGYLNWHWVFYLPITLLVIALVVLALAGSTDQGREGTRPQIDLVGGVLFGVLAALVVYFFNSFGSGFVVDAVFLVTGLGIVAIAVGLVIVESRAASPILRSDFFSTKVIRRSIISALLSGAVMYGFVNTIPIMAGLIAPQIAIKPGMVLLGFMVGMTVGMLIGSRLWAKVAHLPFGLWILMTLAVGAVLACLRLDWYWPLIGANIIAGAILGGIASTVLIYSQNAVSDADRTVLSGIVQLGRYFGAAVGVALMIALIPNVNTVGSLAEFTAPFAISLGLCALGTINERV